MDEILLDLYKIKIVDQSDISKIRSYINSEYAFASKKDKLTMFTSELNKVMDKNLDGLCYSLKSKVRHNLLFEFASGKESRISLGRALDEILLLGSSEELMSLESWFAKSTNIDFFSASLAENLKDKLISFNTQTVNNEFANNFTAKNQKNLSHNNSINTAFSKLSTYTNKFFSLSKARTKKIYIKAITSFIFISIITFSIFNIIEKNSYCEYELDFYTLSAIVNIDKDEHIKLISDIIEESYVGESFGIPKYFEYREIDSSKLLNYLKNRNSLLAEDDRYKTIIEVSKNSNLNPLLLFAIIGQEQGFVDKDNPYSNKIINNPFNVYNSWLNYNTNMKDSTQIAANTIVLRLQNRPKGLDPFMWINETYAEDDRWWIGVKSLYYLLENKAGK